MSNENSNSKKIPRKIKRGLGTRNRGIKGCSTRFWYRIFFLCKHEWEVLEVLWTLPDYGGFKYEVCKCGCKKCGEIRIENFLV